MNEDVINLLPTSQEMTHKAELDMWRMKWKFSLFGGILAAALAFNENLKAKQAFDSQEDEYNKMLNSESLETARIHSEKSNVYFEEVKEHNSNMKNLSIFSIGLFGLATWIWLDKPEPQQSSTRFLIRSSGDEIGFKYNYHW